MSEAAVDYDPILAATVAALSELRPASEALDHIANALSGRDARRAHELGGRLAQERIFDPRDLSAFDPVVEAADRTISAGRVRKVDHKEFGEPDVYWALSEPAQRLAEHKMAVVRLRDALDRLHILRRAGSARSSSCPTRDTLRRAAAAVRSPCARRARRPGLRPEPC